MRAIMIGRGDNEFGRFMAAKNEFCKEEMKAFYDCIEPAHSLVKQGLLRALENKEALFLRQYQSKRTHFEHFEGEIA